MNNIKNGILYGVGVGPGDPELLTIKAIKIIKKSNFIIYPTNKQGKSIAFKIASQYILKSSKKISFYIPMNINRDAANIIYNKTAESLKKYLKNGKIISYLCQGDAFFYGSFYYIFKRLINNFNIKIIPAIPAFIAASAALKIPLIIQNENLQIISASTISDELIYQICKKNNIVIYKIGRHFSKVQQILKKFNLIKKSNLIEYITQTKQKITPMISINYTSCPYFSMIIINKR